jgi:hypothetical protein
MYLTISEKLSEIVSAVVVTADMMPDTDPPLLPPDEEGVDAGAWYVE